MGCASSKRADGPEQASNADPQKQDDESVQSTTDSPQNDAPADDGVTIEVTTANPVCCWNGSLEQAEGENADALEAMQEASEEIGEPIAEIGEAVDAELNKENEVSVETEAKTTACPDLQQFIQTCTNPIDKEKVVETTNVEGPLEESCPAEAVVESDAKAVNCDWPAMKFTPFTTNNENKAENVAEQDPTSVATTE